MVKEGLQGAARGGGQRGAGSKTSRCMGLRWLGLGVGLCMGGWFLSAALLLSAVIITPISVGSLPPVLRVAAVGGVGVIMG